MGETVEHVDEMLMRRGELHARVGLILDGVVEVDRGRSHRWISARARSWVRCRSSQEV